MSSIAARGVNQGTVVVQVGLSGIVELERRRDAETQRRRVTV
jgi:hypothetical protein